MPSNSKAALTFNISADSLGELVDKLRDIGLFVPGRTAGRKTQHTERYTIARLVSTLAKAGSLAFPLSVRHRDRPDFLVEAGPSTIGVEVTEAIAEQYAAYCALAEREFPGAVLDFGLFRWGAPSLSVEQMRTKFAENKLTSGGWAGNSPEEEWALWVQRAVDSKLEKMPSPGFQRFEHNWLSAYDNLPLPNVYLEEAVSIVEPLLAERWRKIPSFDAVFVERGPVIVRITKEGSRHFVLNDLWEY